MLIPLADTRELLATVKYHNVEFGHFSQTLQREHTSVTFSYVFNNNNHGVATAASLKYNIKVPAWEENQFRTV